MSKKMDFITVWRSFADAESEIDHAINRVIGENIDKEINALKNKSHMNIYKKTGGNAWPIIQAANLKSFTMANLNNPQLAKQEDAVLVFFEEGDIPYLEKNGFEKYSDAMMVDYDAAEAKAAGIELHPQFYMEGLGGSVVSYKYEGEPGLGVARMAVVGIGNEKELPGFITKL